jgi:hypothetical protein
MNHLRQGSGGQTHADAKAAYERRTVIVKDRLKADMRSVAGELLQPDAKTRTRGRWAMPSPFRTSSGTTFSIHVTGPKAGHWIDFGGTQKGDAIGLVMAIKNCSFKDAVAWAEERYGLRNMTDEQREATSRAIAKQQAAEDAQVEIERQKKIRNACHMFSKAVPDIEGTLVERYLRSRGIDIRDMPNRDKRWLRFLPDATYWMLGNKPRMPAMIAGMVDGAGVMKACHLTYLRGDGAGKADVKCKRACGKAQCQSKGCQNSPKLMWPEVKGLVIRINHGRGNADPEAAAVAGVKAPLLLCEGIEDGLTLAFADYDLRVWAASSLSNLGNVPDHDCAASFVVAQDNDWAKPQAQASFTQAMERLNGFNKPAVAVRSTVGKDFNDQLKGTM